MSRVEELNDRIYARNQGDTPAFYFSPRPVPTKYTMMPIVEERTKVTVTCKPIFDTSKQFLPGSNAPWSGKASTIDIETQLYRPQGYFPSSQSDLYKTRAPPMTNTVQPHPQLFATVRTSDNGIKTNLPEKQFFYNDTRIKNIS
jgi:hypothetical protein